MINSNNRSFIKLYNEIQKAAFTDKNLDMDASEILRTYNPLPDNYPRFNMLYDITDMDDFRDILSQHLTNARMDIIYFFREIAKIPNMSFIRKYVDNDLYDIAPVIFKRCGEFIEPNFVISKETYEKMAFLQIGINIAVQETNENIIFGYLLILYYLFIQKRTVIINSTSEKIKTTFLAFVEANDMIASTNTDVSNLIFIDGYNIGSKMDTIKEKIKEKDVFIFNYSGNKEDLLTYLCNDYKIRKEVDHDNSVISYSISALSMNNYLDGDLKDDTLLKQDIITINSVHTIDEYLVDNLIRFANNANFNTVQFFSHMKDTLALQKTFITLGNHYNLNKHLFLEK